MCTFWGHNYSLTRCMRLQVATVQSRAAAGTAGATLAQTRALADTLSADPNPKVQNSQFLQFLSKMSRGELIMEDNQVQAARIQPPPCSSTRPCTHCVEVEAFCYAFKSEQIKKSRSILEGQGCAW